MNTFLIHISMVISILVLLKVFLSMCQPCTNYVRFIGEHPYLAHELHKDHIGMGLVQASKNLPSGMLINPFNTLKGNMKYLISVAAFLFFSFSGFARQAKKLQQSWIKTSIENLSSRAIDPDTLYLRYTFERSKLYISFNPDWDNYQQDWSVEGKNLTIGFDTYKIETLNDTALVIVLNGFRRISFLSENYVSNQEQHLDSIGVFNGKPLYKANWYISPRYIKGASLRDVIQKNQGAFNIKKAITFLASFIVTEDGSVEEVKIIKSISSGFDSEIITQLQLTAKKWKPAKYKGNPIQTQVLYQIKYLDSIAPDRYP